MQEVFATVLVALSAIALVAAFVAGARVLHVVAGAWAATGGGVWSRPPKSQAKEEPLPSSRRWPPRREDTFFPTYLPGKDTSADLAAALARATASVRLEHIEAVCRSFRVRCEMRDVEGRVQGIVEPDGRVSRD